MNDLRELIRNARKLQKITDEAVIKALNELESICKNNKYDYQSAEEAVLLFIYDEKIKFLIKHNFRREDRYALADELRKVCKNIQKPREGKTVYIGSTWRKINTEEKGEIYIRAVYEIIDRTMTENGQLIFDTESEINLYLTLLELSDEKVIELYHNHAVCEQYHSEIKTDMDVERLPSGKFDTNALILKLAMLAYNILRIIGTEAMMKHDMPIRHSTTRKKRKASTTMSYLGTFRKSFDVSFILF